MNKINKAYELAMRMHGDTVDDSGENYFISHCLNVYNILRQTTNDEDLLCAGLLHDTLEDTKLTYIELKDKIGTEVADLVYEVTKVEQKDGGHFPNLKTEKGIILKFADRLSNLSRMQCWKDSKRTWYLNKSKFWKE
jgi:GTP pyrophosphokinase